MGSELQSSDTMFPCVRIVLIMAMRSCYVDNASVERVSRVKEFCIKRALQCSSSADLEELSSSEIAEA